tara:strand:+ start:200 stop:7237 length:7038 start_codon:yes stop_codon:yes gene_type:complete
VKDQWFSQVHTGNTPVNVSQLSNPSKITNFYYTTTFSVNQNGEIKTSEILTGISLGNDPDGLIEDREASNKTPDLTTYYITPVGLAGLQRIDKSGVPVTGPDDLVLGSIVDGKLVSLPFNTPLIKAGDYGRIARVELIVDDLQKLDADLDIVEYSGRYITEYEYDINGQLIRRETYYDADIDSQGPVALGSEKWTYDHVGSVKTYMDPLGRVTYFGYDYEIPVTYATAEDDKDFDSSVAEEDRVGGTDATAKYDPTDYEGNVVYIIDLSGVTTFEYETDNETGNAVGTLVKSVDPRGTVTHYERNNEGQLTQLRTVRQYADDYTEEYSYYTSGDQEGLLKTFKDTLGLVTTYYYDGRRLSEKVEEDDSQAVKEVISTEYTYDSHGFIGSESIYDGLANTLVSATVYEYDGTGLLRDVEVFDNGSDVLAHTQYNYDGAGMVIDVIDGRGYVTHNDYDLRGLLLSTTKAQDATYYSYYLQQELDIEEVTQYSYYADGSLKRIEVNNDLTAVPDTGTIQEFFYDPLSFTSWVESGDLTSDIQTVETQTDAYGRVINKTDHLSGASTSYEYGDKRIDLPTKITNQAVLNYSGTPTDLVTTFTYDAVGNLLSEHRMGTPAFNYKYDELGFLKYSSQDSSESTKLAYRTNSAGQIIEQTETRTTLLYDDTLTDYLAFEQDYRTTFEYDERGRLVESTDPVAAANTNDAELPTRRIYDIENGLSKVTSISRTGLTSIQWFDALGRLVKDQNAFGGITSFTYDLSGNLVTEHFQPATGDYNAKESNKAYHYDGLGRLRATEYQNSLTNPQPVYFAVTDYFRIGDAQDWQMATFDALTPDEYDLAAGTGTVDAKKATLSRTDLTGNIVIQHPVAESTGSSDILQTTIQYDYDQASQTYTVTMTTPRGEIGSQDTRTTTTTYNNQGWVLLTTDTDGDQITINVYNGLGQVIVSSNGLGQITTYEYTENHGLVSKKSTYKNATSATLGSLDSQLPFISLTSGLLTTSSYFYDSAGNRTAQSGPNGDIEYFNYDALNRVISNVAYIDTFDNDGKKNGKKPVTRTWAYNGNETVYVDRDDRKITSLFDPINMVITESWDDVLYATQTFNSAGELDKVESKDASIDLIYDQLGRLTEKKTRLDVYVDHTSVTDAPLIGEVYGYTDSGVRKSYQVYVSGNSFVGFTNEYTVDNANRITQVVHKSKLGTADKSVFYDFYRDGQIQQIAKSSSDWDGWFYTTYGYRADGKISSIIQDADYLDENQAQQPRVNILKYEFEYLHDESVGIVTLDEQLRKLQTTHFTAAESNETLFEYDDQNQLKKVVSDSIDTFVETLFDSSGKPVSTETTISGSRDRVYQDDLYTYEYDNEGHLIKRIAKVISERVIDNENDPFSLSSGWEGAEYEDRTRLRGSEGTGPANHFVTASGGLGGKQRVAVGPGLAKIAEYNFNHLTAGTYNIYATWQGISDGCSGEFFQFKTDNNQFQKIAKTIDFSRDPLADKDEFGVKWVLIQAEVNVLENGTIDVRIDSRYFDSETNGAYIIADAVKIVRTDNDGKSIDSTGNSGGTQTITPTSELGDPSNFVTSGKWTAVDSGKNNQIYYTTLDREAYATYSFQHLPVGEYEIKAVWDGGPNRSAVYIIKDGNKEVGRVKVDQDNASAKSGNVIAFVSSSQGHLTVEVHIDDADIAATAVAGAISIERIETATVTEYKWDHRGRLESVISRDSENGPITKQVNYYYNAFNQLIAQEVNENGQSSFKAFVYDGAARVMELDENAQISKQYFVGTNNEVLAVDVKDNSSQIQTRWAISDFRGNLVYWLEADVENGFIVDQAYLYTAYGYTTQVVNEADSLELDAMLNGSVYDKDTGLYFMGSRAYSPQMRRYLSESPAGLATKDLYAFQGNLPVLPKIPGVPASYNPGSDDGSENDVYWTWLYGAHEGVGNSYRRLLGDEFIANADNITYYGVAAALGVLAAVGATVTYATGGVPLVAYSFLVGATIDAGVNVYTQFTDPNYNKFDYKSLFGDIVVGGFILGPAFDGGLSVLGAGARLSRTAASVSGRAVVSAGTRIANSAAVKTGSNLVRQGAESIGSSYRSLIQNIKKGYRELVGPQVKCFVVDTPVLRRMESDTLLLAMPPAAANGEDDWTTVWLVGGIAGLITLNQLTKHKEKKPKRKTSPRSVDTDQWLEENDWTRLIPVPEKREPEWNLSAEDIDGICQELLMGSESRSSFSFPRSRQLPLRETVSKEPDKLNPAGTKLVHKGEKTVSPKESQSSVSEDTRTVKKKSLFKSVLQKMVFFTLTLLAGFCLWKIAPALSSQKTPIHTIPVDETANQPGALPALKAAVEEQGPPEEKSAFLSPQQKGGDV